MRLFYLCFVFICVFSISALGADEINFKMIRKPKAQETDWASSFSSDTTAIMIELKEINESMTKEEVSNKIKNVLNKIKKMRDELKKSGINLESFSLNTTFPPSLTINCRFQE